MKDNESAFLQDLKSLFYWLYWALVLLYYLKLMSRCWWYYLLTDWCMDGERFGILKCRWRPALSTRTNIMINQRNREESVWQSWRSLPFALSTHRSHDASLMRFAHLLCLSRKFPIKCSSLRVRCCSIVSSSGHIIYRVRMINLRLKVRNFKGERAVFCLPSLGNPW